MVAAYVVHRTNTQEVITIISPSTESTLLVGRETNPLLVNDCLLMSDFQVSFIAPIGSAK